MCAQLVIGTVIETPPALVVFLQVRWIFAMPLGALGGALGTRFFSHVLL